MMTEIVKAPMTKPTKQKSGSSIASMTVFDCGDELRQLRYARTMLRNCGG